MIQLNEIQRRYLDSRIDSVNEAHALAVDKLIKSTENPGELSHELSWSTADLMRNDLKRRELMSLRNLMAAEEGKATLQSLEEWYTNELIRWTEQYSTNPCSNLEHQEKRRVYQDTLEVIKTIRSQS